jgi:DNA-binding transcriptional ArsR family regulator
MSAVSSTADRDVFVGIAHPTRRAILELLRERPRPVGELAEVFDVSLPAISKHLRVLRESGLVSESVRGRYRVYYLRTEPLDHALAWLAELRGFWTSRLDSLGRHLYDKYGKPDKQQHQKQPSPPMEES